MDYASRAGVKLQHGLEQFKINVTGFTCADFGSSTGGFVDCLLKAGAAKVYAVETGYGLLDWNLRNDERVVVKERTNALHVKLPEKVDFISIDTSWTKQKNIIPYALTLLKEGGQIVSLLKPHYEADKKLLRKGVLPEENRQEVVERVVAELKDAGIKVNGVTESPVTGSKGGNVEFLIYITK